MNSSVYLNRHFLCIDLKSFFASCECIEQGLDPFTYPLVVANKNQGTGAITLAVTPYLKNKGIKSRGRLFEIPSNIKYEIAHPRMSLYIKKSTEVVSVYLKYVSDADIHIYSIDECFLDVTDYLKMYNKTDYELAYNSCDFNKNELKPSEEFKNIISKMLEKKPFKRYKNSTSILKDINIYLGGEENE